MEHIRYKKETEVVTFQGKEITLENLSPVFTPEQEAVYRIVLAAQHAPLAAVRPGGHIIIATFAAGGPTQSSGLDFRRYPPDTRLSLISLSRSPRAV